MKNTSIYDLVYKVIGEINPVGDSAIDAERKENLKEMIELVERLCTDLHSVSDGLFQKEASVREAGKMAYNALQQICGYYGNI